jgi:hypothetical protein
MESVWTQRDSNSDSSAVLSLDVRYTRLKPNMFLGNLLVFGSEVGMQRRLRIIILVADDRYKFRVTDSELRDRPP